MELERGTNIVFPEECTMQECSEKCQIVVTSDFHNILCPTSATEFKYTTELSTIKSQLEYLTQRIESLAEQQHHPIRQKQFSQTVDQDELLERIQSDLTTYKEEVTVLRAKFENMSSVPIPQDRIDTLANSIEPILRDIPTTNRSSIKRTNRRSYEWRNSSRPLSESFEVLHRTSSTASNVSSGYQSNADMEPCYQDELQDLTAIQELQSISDKENIDGEDSLLLTSTPHLRTDDQNWKNEQGPELLKNEVVETLSQMSKLLLMLRRHMPEMVENNDIRT